MVGFGGDRGDRTPRELYFCRPSDKPFAAGLLMLRLGQGTIDERRQFGVALGKNASLAKFRDGLGGVPLREQGEPEVVVGIGGARDDANHDAVFVDRLRQLPLFLQGEGAVEAGAGIARLGEDGLSLPPRGAPMKTAVPKPPTTSRATIASSLSTRVLGQTCPVAARSDNGGITLQAPGRGQATHT